jgi:hypothetical protein
MTMAKSHDSDITLAPGVVLPVAEHSIRAVCERIVRQHADRIAAARALPTDDEGRVQDGPYGYVSLARAVLGAGALTGVEGTSWRDTVAMVTGGPRGPDGRALVTRELVGLLAAPNAVVKAWYDDHWYAASEPILTELLGESASGAARSPRANPLRCPRPVERSGVRLINLSCSGRSIGKPGDQD